MADEIDAGRFNELVADAETPDWVFHYYLEEDLKRSRAFAPVLRGKANRVAPETIDALGGMEYWNKVEHKNREKKYRKMIADGYAGPKIVSEGDSWFLYPILIDEVVDHLYDRYAIFSWGAAGDDLNDMVAQKQFIPAIREENADIFLISGGGNDVLGEIASNLKPFNPDYNAMDYPNEHFNDTLDCLTVLFRTVFSDVSNEFANVRTFCHGYDYAVPGRPGKWLAAPMRDELGIKDNQLQRAIVRVLIDQFNDRLERVAAEFHPRVSYINCRGAVPEDHDWRNEIHPTSDGFKNVATLFFESIETR